jgi:hypothetical protein
VRSLAALLFIVAMDSDSNGAVWMFGDLTRGTYLELNFRDFEISQLRPLEIVNTSNIIAFAVI